ncbi:MAG TPA: Gfo/Idh/MocA family oxidoreductase [Candidatus Nanopelagicales bacterium]
MAERPLRVALIGVGDIAAKAYLPVLAADATVHPVLVTRDEGRRARLQAAWRIDEAFRDVPALLAGGHPPDAAFVHAATVAHPELAHALIDAAVPTFVDKPLALTLADSRAIVEHARAAHVSLAVLFNRRFAPAYAELASWPGLDTVVLTKNRHRLPDEARWFVVDDFVHVVDTLRFLVGPDVELVDVAARRSEDGRLGRLAIVVRSGGRVGVGIMDRDGGQTVEVLEAMAPGRSRRVTDLVDVVDRHDGVELHAQPSNWASVSAQRGFVAMVASLLASVRHGEVLDAGDALMTHLLCEEVLRQAVEQAG